MLEALAAKRGQMKKADTKVRQPGGIKVVTSEARSVLVLSRSWKASYQWMDEDVKVVIFLTKGIRSGFAFADSQSYAHIEVFEDLDSPMVDWKAIELHKNSISQQYIVCLGEEDLVRCARIRKQLGLEGTGQTIENALRYRDKIVMKDLLKSKGVLVPTYQAVDDNQALIEFFQTHGPKIVIKPRTGYGSVQTSIINSEEEMIKFLSTTIFPLDVPYGLDVEKYVEGPMYHVDGFVWNGKLTLCWPSVYVNMCIDFTSAKWNASHSLHRDNPIVPRLQKYVESVVSVLEGPTLFPFHAEVWHTPDDQLILCEIASRVGGAGIRHAFEGLFDVLLDKLWVQSQTGSKVTYAAEKQTGFPRKNPTTGWIILFPSEGTLVKRPEQDDGEDLPYVLKYFPIASPGKKFQSAAHSADAIAMFIVKGDTEEEVKANLFRAFDWYQENSAWEK